MAPTVAAGHETRLYYQYEDRGFNQPNDDTTEKTFGANARLTTAQGSNAIRRVYRPGFRAGIEELAMLFEGSFSVQFSLTNPFWLRAILGEPDKTGTGPDYTYEYSLQNDGTPVSLRLYVAHEPTSIERIMYGAVVTNVSIDTTVEEEVQVTLDGLYADSEKNNGIAPQPTTGSRDPLTYAEGAVDVDGSTETFVQSATLSVENNIDLIREMGSRIAVDYNPKTVNPSLDVGRIFDQDTGHDNLERMFGGLGTTQPQEDADENTDRVDLRFDNGKAAGSGINEGSFELTGSLIDSYDESGVGDPQADLEEALTRVALEPSATWTIEAEPL